MLDSSLMQLLWLASPALPVGGFSYSECLESAVDKAYAATENEASHWLIDQLHLSLARSDLPAIAQAITAWREGDDARVGILNAWILQTRESAELRAQTEQMGKSLLDWLRNHTTATREHIQTLTRIFSTQQPTYPIAFALAASATQADVRACLIAYSFGWAENMVQAAIKSVPLGQSAGQRVLSHIVAEIPAAIDYALTVTDATRQAFTPMLAILSCQHEIQYSRLFRS